MPTGDEESDPTSPPDPGAPRSGPRPPTRARWSGSRVGARRRGRRPRCPIRRSGGAEAPVVGGNPGASPRSTSSGRTGTTACTTGFATSPSPAGGASPGSSPDRGAAPAAHRTPGGPRRPPRPRRAARPPPPAPPGAGSPRVCSWHGRRDDAGARSDRSAAGGDGSEDGPRWRSSAPGSSTWAWPGSPFPRGTAASTCRPNLQREVDRRLAEAGATPPGAREFFGLTMAGPTVVTHGSEPAARTAAASDVHRRGVVVPAVQRTRSRLGPGRTGHPGGARR